MFRMAFLLMLKNYLYLYNPLYLGLSDVLDEFSVLKELYDIFVKRCVFKFR